MSRGFRAVVALELAHVELQRASHFVQEMQAGVLILVRIRAGARSRVQSSSARLLKYARVAA
jgi:hypothetical protein